MRRNRVLGKKPRKSCVMRPRKKKVSRRRDWVDNFKYHGKEKAIKARVN